MAYKLIGLTLFLPCSGVNSQVELIRELSSPDQLVVIKPLLDMADVCLETLRDVLDDT